MKHLIEAAVAVGLTLETAELPEGERSRYIPSQQRIIVATGLNWMEFGEAVLVMLAHAEQGDIERTPANRARAVTAVDAVIARAAAERNTAEERARAKWQMRLPLVRPPAHVMTTLAMMG